MQCACVLVLAAVCSGCLVRQKVTRGGVTVKDGYTFKRPIKEAIQNSQ